CWKGNRGSGTCQPCLTKGCQTARLRSGRSKKRAGVRKKGHLPWRSSPRERRTQPCRTPILRSFLRAALRPGGGRRTEGWRKAQLPAGASGFPGRSGAREN
ncbi:MAG: hypothetical protein AVDCRST_MAG56-990, partial [uncultured Cytophagales bacterium]